MLRVLCSLAVVLCLSVAVQADTLPVPYYTQTETLPVPRFVSSACTCGTTCACDVPSRAACNATVCPTVAGATRVAPETTQPVYAPQPVALPSYQPSYYAPAPMYQAAPVAMPSYQPSYQPSYFQPASFSGFSRGGCPGGSCGAGG